MKKQPTSRRTLMKDFFRVLTAALLAWFGIRLASRPRDPHACTNQGLCRGCSAYSVCILPQARSLKENPGYKPGRGPQVDKFTSLQDGKSG